MIINNFLGGLGNQLFQIAAGYAHAKRMNSKFAINYRLNHVGFGQGYHPKKYKDSVYKNIPTTDQEISLVYSEKEFTYNSITPIDTLCLHGYFQSERYFEEYKEEIKRLFSFEFETKKKIRKQLNSIKKKVGVHIRLGDYLNKEYEGVFHKINYPVYLEKAMSYFDSDHKFLLFSDDFESLQKLIDLKKFINLKNSNEVEDMYSLSQCDSVIMSNSSFSWWGTWLGKKKEKIISPDQWFGHRVQKDYEDRFSKKWIKISSKK